MRFKCYLDHQLIAWLYRCLEAGFIHPRKQVYIFLIRLRVDNQTDKNGRGLSDAFEHQYARKDRAIGKMAFEEWFVDGDIFERRQAFPRRQADDPIDEQKRIAMREYFPNPMNIDFFKQNTVPENLPFDD